MSKSSDTPDKPFLGAPQRFNPAGENVPLPGEKVAGASSSSPSSSRWKILIGILVIVALFALLWIVFGEGVPGTMHQSGHAVSRPMRPTVNPDSAGQ